MVGNPGELRRIFGGMERTVTTGRGWTKRQREVLDLLARGRTNAEIATALGITAVASPLGYEWQPDAVYRPQLPLN